MRPTDPDFFLTRRAAKWIVAIFVIAASMFGVGCFWQFAQLQAQTTLSIRQIGLFSLFPLALVVFVAYFCLQLDIGSDRIQKMCKCHTDAIAAISDARLGIWIVLAAGLGLYTELLVIRLHTSYFQLFAYFKNMSLLSCFLGLGIGYALGNRYLLTTPLVLPLLALQIVPMRLLSFTGFASGLENPISEHVAFGMSQSQNISHLLTVYGFIIMVFTFNAICFIPLGQLASHLMARKPKLVAYGWNLIGSIAGVLVFSLISFLWTPPVVWIALAAVALLLFLRHHGTTLFPTSLALAILLLFLAVPFRLDQTNVYSPYQILSLNLQRNAPPEIQSSNTYYQRILDLSEENVTLKEELKGKADYYDLPYKLKPNPDHVLIVGCGAGNDAAAGIRNRAGQIDAVEIDPVILRFGNLLHPESPYNTTNVNSIVNDARVFIRHTDKRYDLIVYGLLDSHTLLSGRSGGVRLDSFVYTTEAFREARSALKPNGMICVTFGVIRPELGRKLFLMLQDAFDGKPPIAYQTQYDGGVTFVAGAGVQDAARRISVDLAEVTDRFASETIEADPSTDDWPFFYMPIRKYPVTYAAMVAVLMGLSVVFVMNVMPREGRGFSLPCFFLGTGFMLIETKGITELALVYGSTWMVISVVILGILVMGFLANLIIIRIATPHPLLTYGALIVSLVVGLVATSGQLSHVASWASQIGLSTVLTIPLFFSGFAFSAELKRTPSVAVALSSNLLGAMLGGFLEYNSMRFGFDSLYYVAIAVYALALGTSLLKR